MSEKLRIEGLTGKIEATEGVDANPAPGTDGIQVEEFLWPTIEVDYLHQNPRDNAAIGGLGRTIAGSRSARWAQVRLPVVVKGAGSAYSASNLPEMDVPLQVSAHTQTIDTTPGSEFVSYKPGSTGHQSATLYVYTGGLLHKLLGTRGNLDSLLIQPGLITIANFVLRGILEDDPTELALPSIAYPHVDVIPPAPRAAGLTLNAFDPDDFRSVTLELNAEVEDRPGGNATEGIAGFEINDWNPQLTVVMDRPPLASFNYFTLEKAATAFAWDVDMGATQYNKATLSGSLAQILQHRPQADRGFATIQLLMRLANSSSLNDSYELLFD